MFMYQFCISLSTRNTVSKLTVNKAKNCNITLGLTYKHAAVFGRNQTCFPGPCFAQFFLKCKNIFPPFYQYDCFTSGIVSGDAL